VVKCILAFLKLYLYEFSTRPTSLKELNSHLFNSINIFYEIENISINTPNSKIIIDKLKYVLKKIEGYKTIKTYSEVMTEN
jgi:hypothetical protein